MGQMRTKYPTRVDGIRTMFRVSSRLHKSVSRLMNIQGGRKLAAYFKASVTENSRAAGIKFAFTGKKV